MKLRRQLIFALQILYFLNYYKESVVTFVIIGNIVFVELLFFLRTGCTTNAITSTIFLSSHPGMCSLALPGKFQMLTFQQR